VSRTLTLLRHTAVPQVTRLTPAQFAAVTNLEFLGVPVFKRKGAGGLFFGRKRKRNVRKVAFRTAIRERQTILGSPALGHDWVRPGSLPSLTAR